MPLPFLPPRLDLSPVKTLVKIQHRRFPARWVAIIGGERVATAPTKRGVIDAARLHLSAVRRVNGIPIDPEFVLLKPRDY